MATKTSFYVKLLVGSCLSLGMAGGLLAQPALNVTINGTLGPVTGGTGEVTLGHYFSGITAIGSANQYCEVGFIDPNGVGSGAKGRVALSGTNTIASNTKISLIDSPGSGYSRSNPPTTAKVVSGGTATCVGSSAVVTAVIDDPLGTNNQSFTATTSLNPVGVTYNASSITYSPLKITFTSPSLGTLSCTNAQAVVMVNDPTAGGDDTLTLSKCSLTAILTAAFTSKIAFPPGTIPAPLPLALSAGMVSSNSSTTYTVEGGTFTGDRTVLGLSGSLTTVCSSCPSETLTPPGPLTFTAQAGGSAPAQNVTVGTGGTLMPYAVTTSTSSGGNWLTVNGASTSGGQTGGSFAVDVFPAASLAPGNYTGAVNVYTSASNSSQTVTVNLTVPFGLVAPPPFVFNSVNSASPPSQSLLVTTSPSSQVPFTASASSTGGWLSVSPITGTTGVTTITVSADPTKAPPGVNGGTITLTATGATNSPLTVNVTFNVTTVPTPSALTFTGIAGGSNPSSQPLSVTSTAGPTVSYTAAVTSGSSWLSVSPSGGTTNGSALTVSVNTTGLSANTYHGTITITPSGGAAIPVGVTLTVTSPLPSMVPGSPSLTFNYTPGSAPSQALGITSSGGAITYNVAASTTTGGSWLQVLPASGATPGSETVSIVTSVASTLATGTYNGAVVFTCSPTSSCGNTNGQLSVPVTLTVTATLTPVPSSLPFTYTIGGSTPAPVPIGVTSNGGAITYTATAATTSGGNWLAVSPGSATTPTGVTASVNAAALTGLAAGTYNGSITLTSTGASNNPVTIPATLVVSSALGTSSPSFTFAYQIGGSTPATQPLTITSNGAALTFTASPSTTSGGSWLSVSSPTGPTPQTLTVSTVQSVLSSLTAGNYSGSITITSAQAGNSPVIIPVTLTVSAHPSLTTAPSSLSFSYTINGSVPGSQPVTVGTTGTSPLTGVSASTATPWLSASLSGTATPATMTVSLVQANLPSTAGVYQGSVTINATGAAAPLSYPVTLNVSAQPALTVGPPSLTFTGQVGGANPGSQTLSVTSINGSVSFTAVPTTTSGGSWLSVSSPAGATNTTLQISVNTKGLAVGNYSGAITVTASGASGSPAVIPVSLTVTALPLLITTPSTLSFSYTTGSAAPAGQSVAVSTSNSASAAFSVSASTTSGGSWLQVSPTSGASPASFVASFVPGSLTAGTYNGTITVSATGFTSATVAVTVVVTQPKATIQITGSAVFSLANSAAPVTNTLTISSSDGSPQAFTITEGSSPNNNWLTLSATSGTAPANIKLTANPAGLMPGIYVIPLTVTMKALPVPAKTILAQLTVTGSNLVASPAMLSFTYQLGLPLPAAQTVSLTAASGNGSVALSSITANVGWLRITPASSVPAMLQVSINPGPLTTGTLTGDILVTAVGSPDVSLQIPVTITVTAAPQFTATPASLAFNYQIGGAAPASQSIALASGSVPLNFTATSPGNWLQLSPQRGTTPGSVLVTANPAGLPAGTYGGTINVNTFGVSNSAAVAVTLTITAPPQITIAPSQLFFAIPVGGTAPAPLTLTVTSNDGPLAFTAAAGSIWLGVTPTSGTAPATLAVSVIPAGLSIGTYNGTIDITQAGSAVPQMILVTLQVGSGGPTPTIAGVINAASGAAGTVAPGMAISIFGTTLGPQTGVGFAAPPEGGTVAPTLAGTEVLFDGARAPVLFTLNGQVNALAPFELANKTNTVLQVVYNGVTSVGMTLPVVPAEPGLFTADATGKGQGAILNQDYGINSASNPAAQGSAIMLFGTGAGLTDPPSTDGALNPMPPPFGKLTLEATATVGGQPAQVLYAGPAPGLVSGIFQINVTLPSGTPSGNVPVTVQVGTAGSQTVTVAVQ